MESAKARHILQAMSDIFIDGVSLKHCCAKITRIYNSSNMFLSYVCPFNLLLGSTDLKDDMRPNLYLSAL